MRCVKPNKTFKFIILSVFISLSSVASAQMVAMPYDEDETSAGLAPYHQQMRPFAPVMRYSSLQAPTPLPRAAARLPRIPDVLNRLQDKGYAVSGRYHHNSQGYLVVEAYDMKRKKQLNLIVDVERGTIRRRYIKDAARPPRAPIVYASAHKAQTLAKSKIAKKALHQRFVIAAGEGEIAPSSHVRNRLVVVSQEAKPNLMLPAKKNDDAPPKSTANQEINKKQEFNPVLTALSIKEKNKQPFMEDLNLAFPTHIFDADKPNRKAQIKVPPAREVVKPTLSAGRENVKPNAPSPQAPAEPIKQLERPVIQASPPEEPKVTPQPLPVTPEIIRPAKVPSRIIPLHQVPRPLSELRSSEEPVVLIDRSRVAR